MSTIAEHLKFITDANAAGDRRAYEYHAVLLVDGHLNELLALSAAPPADEVMRPCFDYAPPRGICVECNTGNPDRCLWVAGARKNAAPPAAAVNPLSADYEAGFKAGLAFEAEHHIVAPMPAGGEIDEMVNRFLAWKLPEDFHPDAGISFQRFYTFADPSWPVGTNLFNAVQAKAMFTHCVGAIYTAPVQSAVTAAVLDRAHKACATVTAALRPAERGTKEGA